jgi:hypothetical protein
MLPRDYTTLAASSATAVAAKALLCCTARLVIPLWHCIVPNHSLQLCESNAQPELLQLLHLQVLTLLTKCTSALAVMSWCVAEPQVILIVGAMQMAMAAYGFQAPNMSKVIGAMLIGIAGGLTMKFSSY